MKDKETKETLTENQQTREELKAELKKELAAEAAAAQKKAQKSDMYIIELQKAGFDRNGAAKNKPYKTALNYNDFKNLLYSLETTNLKINKFIEYPKGDEKIVALIKTIESKTKLRGADYLKIATEVSAIMQAFDDYEIKGGKLVRKS